MLKTYGRARATSIVAPITHHAQGVAVIATGLMNGLLASKVARDDRVHQLHMGSGAQGNNLYLDNGASFAFRAEAGKGGGYDRVVIYGKIRPLGNVVATVTDPKQVPAAIKKIEKAL